MAPRPSRKLRLVPTAAGDAVRAADERAHITLSTMEATTAAAVT
jgi:hypothetical protein